MHFSVSTQCVTLSLFPFTPHPDRSRSGSERSKPPCPAPSPQPGTGQCHFPGDSLSLLRASASASVVATEPPRILEGGVLRPRSAPSSPALSQSTQEIRKSGNQEISLSFSSRRFSHFHSWSQQLTAPTLQGDLSVAF